MKPRRKLSLDEDAAVSSRRSRLILVRIYSLIPYFKLSGIAFIRVFYLKKTISKNGPLKT